MVVVVEVGIVFAGAKARPLGRMQLHPFGSPVHKASMQSRLIAELECAPPPCVCVGGVGVDLLQE